MSNKGFVLSGHGFTNNKTDGYVESLHKDFNQFKKTIEIFEDLGFEFISMTELISLAKNNFRYDKNWIHLTFDDGYKNNYTLVYPYLKEKNIPFSLFISTTHIENNTRFYTYKIRCALLNTRKEVYIPHLNCALAPSASRRTRIRFCKKVIETIYKKMNKSEAVDFMEYTDSLLTSPEWEYYNNLYCEDEVLTINQLKELAGDKLVHIGSHNHHHLILNQNVSNDDILYEMQTSKIWLQKNLGMDILTYCYPSGGENNFSPNSKTICQNLGYVLAFTTIKQLVSSNTDRYEIPRLNFPIGPFEMADLLAKLLVFG